ncbi:MAG: PhzF family phenazine biosynthesis protein [Caulobacteraceae bacterium]
MRQWTIDAFASAPFKGNPACVVEPLGAWPDAGWMQSLAAENNQAETAFLLTTGDAARFGLRWFTPAMEVPLCGHATLASGHALFAELGLDTARVTFETASGELGVTRAATGYEMDLPADPPRRVATPPGLAEALGADPVAVWAAGYLVAVLADEAAVRALTPDIGRLATITGGARAPGNIGVAALAGAGAPCDVVSRFFAPGSGIAEDPTTGSLHCILSPLFSDTLARPTLRFHQAFPGRGGDLECTLRGERVALRGQAVTVIESRLKV